MKNTLASAGLLGIALLLVACSGNPQRPFTVTGEFLVAEAEEVPDYIQGAIDSGQLEVDEPIDISTVSVSIVHKVKNESGKMVEEVLASGSFDNGQIELEGTISSPTNVSISVDVGSDEPLKLDAVVAPSQSIAFKLVDQLTPASRDQLVLSEEYRIYEDSSAKYVISGDLSALDEDLTYGEVEIFGSTWDDEKQTTKRLTLGPVNPKDGKFLIEGTTSHPMVVTVYATAGQSFFNSVQAIVETGVEIDVSVDGSNMVVSAPEGSSHHSVVDSWAKSGEFLAKVKAYDEAYDAHMKEVEAKREEAEKAAAAAAESAEEEGTPAEEVAETTEDASDATETETVAVVDEEESETVAVNQTPNAAGCEHVDTSNFQALDLWSYEPPSTGEDSPEYMKLSIEVSDYRARALQKIAENLEDPLSALLAVEIGAYTSREDQLTAYEKLATSSLDSELIERRVIPSRDRIVAQMETETNDRDLVPGQKAPEFKLASLEGGEVSLYDTLESNDYVLVDFWASWCGPCIASFPKLKKLHSAFNDDGFEIITVSIDATFDEWANKSKSLELPWIDLGEVDGGGFQGPTAVDYGVGWIPKGYMVDSKGCILDKDMPGEKLQEMLVAQYGDRPELQEETEEAESSESVEEGGGDEA